MIPAEAERAFWLDGGGSTRWSGRRTIVGVLDDDDVSLTFDAARREVTRHQGGRSEVVGDDIFDALREGLDGDPDTHWVGVLGYASRSDLPGRPTGLDAVWMRSRRVQVTEARHPYAGAWWPAGHGLGYEHLFTHQAVDFVRAVAGEIPPAPSFAARPWSG